MDALAVLPALLALMVATLAALGYALHRLAEANSSGDAPLSPAWPCSYCGQRLNASWSHCPMCGAALWPATSASMSEDTAAVESGHPGSSVERNAGTAALPIAGGSAHAITDLERVE